MVMSDKELLKLRKLLFEIDNGLNKPRYRSYVQNRTRNIRLMLTRASRREKGTLL